MTTVLEVKGLNKSFGGLQAVFDVNLFFQEREMSAIIGPNGAGKTTLFNLISGFIPPSSGSIIFHGQEMVGNRWMRSPTSVWDAASSGRTSSPV
jgi:branched-chain amino acid transport system ATP-binding protein